MLNLGVTSVWKGILIGTPGVKVGTDVVKNNFQGVRGEWLAEENGRSCGDRKSTEEPRCWKCASDVCGQRVNDLAWSYGLCLAWSTLYALPDQRSSLEPCSIEELLFKLWAF